MVTCHGISLALTEVIVCNDIGSPVDSKQLATIDACLLFEDVLGCAGHSLIFLGTLVHGTKRSQSGPEMKVARNAFRGHSI